MTKHTAKFTNHVLEEFEVDTLGLPYPVVVRGAAIERRDAETGEVVAHAVPDMQGLEAAVAVARALCPVRLSGAELRFMRKAVGVLSKNFAAAVGLDPSSYSRYENDKDQMGGYVEQLVRQHVCEELRDRAPAVDYSPKKIIGMVILNEWPATPRFVLDRVIFKDSVSRSRSATWDTVPIAA